MSESQVSIFGVRHHGPGSARSLRAALDGLRPDCILVEGPPDAADVLALAAHEAMTPPVALLVYDPESPRRASFHPFAEFSPEWQAIRFGLEHGIPVRFMDLPQATQFALREVEAEPELEPEGKAESEPELEPEAEAPDEDPLELLARAAGYSDGERFWEHFVEHRRDAADIFAAILEAMTALRESGVESPLQRRDAAMEARREAHMRQVIRIAQKDGFTRIAVTCGAWHGPALAKMPPAKDDAALLKGLPKSKVVATWVPWTYGRLAASSGYGAGVESPGWHDFLWSRAGATSQEIATAWLVKVARLLRDEDLDASSASVIEAVRLADTLAAMRGRPLPGLVELNEATRAALAGGDVLPLRLVGARLIVGERLGRVPDDTPMVPLAQALAREQKRLRFPPEATAKDIDLDLRKPGDLERSHLLHRLALLGIHWGERTRTRGAQSGTFHEPWKIQWKPELSLALIEAGVWGITLPEAAAAKASRVASETTSLVDLTSLLDATMLADLPDATQRVMARVSAVAAVASDVSHLMAALPPLTGVLRYGNVRRTDVGMVTHVVDGMIARICIGLPGACGSLSDEAAEEMFALILGTQAAVALLENPEHLAAWQDVLLRLADAPGGHGLIAGRACRLLHESQRLDGAEAARRLSLALSTANSPEKSAAWVDGFLRRSGILLIHDAELWRVVDEWLTGLAPDHFITVLPLLRRTFSTFETGERTQLGDRVARGTASRAGAAAPATGLDTTRADKALPLLAAMLGLQAPGEELP